MNDPDILTDLDPADERAEPPPATYPQEAERITRVSEYSDTSVEYTCGYYDGLAARDSRDDELERLQAELDARKLEAQAAFTEALLSLAEYAPSGGFVAPSNVRRILVRMAERLGVKL